MTVLRQLTCFAFLAVVFVFCSKPAPTPDPQRQADTTPVIVSLSPTSGGYNDVVAIIGKNFSTATAQNTVTLNGHAATVILAKSDTLLILVPLAAGTGPVTVTVNNKTANGPVFTYLANQVSTVYGNGISDWTNGASTLSPVNNPVSLAFDAQGNLYIGEYNRIKKVTPSGTMTVLAGSGNRGYLDGLGTGASFNPVMGIAVDNSGNVYVADRDDEVIRKVTPAGLVSTFAGSPGAAGYQDGTGPNAKFWEPMDLAIDGQGYLYVIDRSNYRVRKISPSGAVTTLAGSGVQGYQDGPGASAQFGDIQGIAVDNQGSVYVSDRCRIRKISPAGVVSTFAGSGAANYANGTGLAAEFTDPVGLCVDKTGNVYVADTYNILIRKITPTGVVTKVAGKVYTKGYQDGTSDAALFYYPNDVEVGPDGNLYVADRANNRIRKISLQ